ncbi:MAG TPA: hypothetical protein VM118_05530 [Acidobacteriota bacterium]|nr:hypothetical protein [Acidobacteriota bacterium]
MKRVTEVAGLVLVLLVFVVGCSSAPDREEADARAALRRATEAEAPTFALQELTLAQTEFDRALEEKKRQDERFRLLRSYGVAKEAFLHSNELAEGALAAAQRNRAARADESGRLLDQAQRAIEACSDTLAGAPPGGGKGVKVDLAIFKDDILILAGELETIRPYITAGSFDSADALSLAISRRATALQEEIISTSRKRR